MTGRGLLFRVVVRVISLGCVVRDRLLGRLGPIATGLVNGAIVERHSIRSGRNLLDAVYVRPAEGEARSVLLICHGIGEAVEHWYPVQLLLAAKGVASLVFDYSGYGRSTGAIGAAQCDEDAVAAFEFLQGLVPSRRIALLGFSMGSGVVASILGRVKPERMVLCAAFTSFKAAVRVLGMPRFLAEPIWETVESAAWMRAAGADCSWGEGSAFSCFDGAGTGGGLRGGVDCGSGAEAQRAVLSTGSGVLGSDC